MSKTCALAGWNLRDGINIAQNFRISANVVDRIRQDREDGYDISEMSEELSRQTRLGVLTGLGMIRHEITVLKEDCNIDIDVAKIKGLTDKILKSVEETDLTAATNNLERIQREVELKLRGFQGL